jgi:hypothetical protein
MLNSGIGVSAVDMTILYDPALLTIDAVKLGSAITAGTSLAYEIPTPGTINVTVSSAIDLTTTPGQIALLSLVRADTGNPGQFLSPLVPATAQYGGKHVLDIVNLHAFDSTPFTNEVPSAADDGVHVAAYPGELNGNQAYNGPDAAFAQQIVLNPATSGLVAYQLADPLIVADINGSGTMQASDVSQIQRLILNQASPFVPSRPTGLPAPAAGLDPKLFITTSEPSAAPGESFTMSVNMLVTEPGGITFGGGNVGVTYDPNLFTVSSISAGDLTTGNGFSSSADFATPGVIQFTALTMTDGLVMAFNSQGTIFTATFDINTGAAAGSSLLNITSDATGRLTELWDGSIRRNNLAINPAVTNGDDTASGVDATFTIVREGAVDDFSPEVWWSAMSARDAEICAVDESFADDEEYDAWLLDFVDSRG